MSVGLIIFIIIKKGLLTIPEMPSKEQSGTTTQMAWENRLALDMMFPQKGGVCISNNTAPDGTVTGINFAI
jgi:hypothetical protein